MKLEACHRLVAEAVSLDSSLEDKQRRVHELEVRLAQQRSV